MQLLGRTTPACRRPAGAAAAALVLLSLAACSTDELLSVEDPDVVQPGSIDDARALPAISAAAVGDLAYAVAGDGGNSEGQVQLSGLLADEWRSSDTFPTRNDIDKRTVRATNAENERVYATLQRARASAERAAEAYGRLRPNVVPHAEAHSLAGFAYVLAAENYCSGQPFSRVKPDGTLEYGAPETTQEVLAHAVAHFDSALAALAADATDSPEGIAAGRWLARVGKARALLDDARHAEAAATVAGESVPSGFRYVLDYSSNTFRQNNGVWVFSNSEGRFSVADNEGGTGLPFASAGDPRVPSTPGENVGTSSFDGVTPLVAQLKYPTKDADIVLASGVEARLVEAEAALRAGAAGDFLAALNAARAELPALQPLTSADVPAAEAGRVELLYRERAYALWLTAHRLGDLRRLVRQYGRAVDAVFPRGAYPKGDAYGTDVSLPVPVSERNNPKFTGCDASVP